MYETSAGVFTCRYICTFESRPSQCDVCELCRRWLLLVGSIRAALLLRRVGTCLLLLVAAQYVFLAIFVYQPYVAVTSSLAGKSDAIDETKPASATSRTTPATASSTVSGADRHNVSERKLNLFSVLQQHLVQFFSTGYAEDSGRHSLPPCPAPSKYPGYQYSQNSRCISLRNWWKNFLNVLNGYIKKTCFFSFN
jgi:hypothetical protein